MRFLLAVVVIALLGSSFAAPEYDEAAAIRNMMFAGSTYCYAKSKGASSYAPWGTMSTKCIQQSPDFELLQVFYDSGANGFGILGISHLQQEITLAFKGTETSEPTDLVIDSKNVLTFPKDCKLTTLTGRAHEGFCIVYRRLRALGVLDAVAALKNQFPDYQVVATGHSLGGAIAMLFALDIMSSQNIPVALYTYGQPRTVASDLAGTFNSLVDSLPMAQFWRVTHYKDVIPHTPACNSFSYKGRCKKDNLHGYHAGIEIHYVDKQMNRYKQCSPLDGADCFEMMPTSVDDHLYYFREQVSRVCCPNIKDDEDEKLAVPDEAMQQFLATFGQQVAVNADENTAAEPAAAAWV